MVLSDSEELCPQVVEGETYEENSAESARFLVSGWKEERYFVLCRIDQNIQSPATSHQSPMACVSWQKNVQEGKFSSLYENSFFLLLYGLDMKDSPEVS